MKIKSQRLVIQVGTSMGGTAFSSGRRHKSKEGAMLGKQKSLKPSSETGIPERNLHPV